MADGNRAHPIKACGRSTLSKPKWKIQFIRCNCCMDGPGFLGLVE